MDATSEKSCLEEISTLVLDANEKVTLKNISNNWQVTNAVAQEVLLKWLDKNEKKAKDLVKEFVVQGKNSQGVYRISVVSEEKLAVLKKKWEKFSSMLYSVDTKSAQNSRKLNLPDYEPIKVINILLSPRAPRDLHFPEIVTVKEEPAATKKAEPVKPKTPFDVTAKKSETKPKVPAAEIKSPPAVKSIEPAVEVKTEKQSPKESKAQSPEETKATTSKAQPNKKVQLKNQKPVQKGSISSFFNKPSTSKTAVKPREKTPVKSPVKHEISSDDEPLLVVTKKLAPEKPAAQKQEPKKKPADKKIKLKAKASNKRSRIREVEDSSEEEAKSDSDEPEQKLIKFDREFTPERETATVVSPTATPETKAGKSKAKAKRWVTKRYEAADGFIKTERVLEEYSASEGENDENRKKNSPQTKPKAVEKKKATPVKAKPAQSGKTKNGNIASFFSKK